MRKFQYLLNLLDMAENQLMKIKQEIRFEDEQAQKNEAVTIVEPGRFYWADRGDTELYACVCVEHEGILFLTGVREDGSTYEYYADEWEVISEIEVPS